MQRLELYAGKLARTVLRGQRGRETPLLPTQTLETKARFINQIMTGESGVRRAEDIGGQELSFAEVKAIASGNPAVLTLAEADAELQRLAVLRRNHSDEQFIARRKLKELPETIARLEKWVKALTSDQQGVTGWKGEPLAVNGKPYSLDAAMTPLSRVLEGIPEVSDRRFPLGKYRGLTFGIEYRWNNADVYLSGEDELRAQLSKESRGARAVLNALNRITASYDERIESNVKELALAQTQLHDYEARLGKPFSHAEYLEKLTTLRDRLKTALSETPTEGEPSAAELAEEIKTLKDAQVIEAAPVRVKPAPRIELVRRREEQPPTSRPEQKPEVVRPEDASDGGEEEPGSTFRDQVKQRSIQRSLF
jgi:hypothetical protein